MESPKSILENALTSMKSGDTRDGADAVINSNASTDVFSVDRGKIQAVSEDNQADELKLLGLSVYDQAALEQGILDQVDRALEEDDRRKLEKEQNLIAADISACTQLLKHSESLLLKATAKETISLRNDINKRSRQLQTLKARETSLLKKLHPNSLTIETEIKSETSTAHLLAGNETERERKIRLGEMTPFGSTVGSNNQGTISALDKYLESQAKLHHSRKKSRTLKKKVPVTEEVVKPKKEPSIKKNLYSPLKKSIMQPKKRRKKEVVGSSTSTNSWQPKPHGPVLSEVTEQQGSDSEYQPSESEAASEEESGIVSVKPRKRRKQRADAEAWGTDDSDWESSDEEGRLRRRRKAKRSIDDGNLVDFEDRLKLWTAEEKKSDLAGEDTMHCLDGGFQIPMRLWSKLYKYQQVGVQWLWELHQQRCGGILGDEMGLGKTIQVIAFFAGLASSPITDRHNCFKGLGPSLVVCPTTVMHQWVREFHTWFPPCRVSILHESGSHVGCKESLVAAVRDRAVLVTSYSGLVLNKDALLARDWHYVVLDEGHKIRNPDAQVTITSKQLRTPHRLILSGSPMQNHLKELWSLFDFTFPGKLGTLPVFLAQLAVPITQGGYANASQVQVATAYRCASVLRDTIAPYLLRRLKPDVQAHTNLPAKSEQVLFCRLTEEQRELYKGYLDSGEVARIVDGRTKVFVGLIQLRKICNHPDIYSGGRKLMRWENEADIPEEERYGHWRKAGKMLVIESLLKIWRRQGHRVLLFTQSRQMLQILESFVVSHGYSYLKLDGQTSISSRQPLIAKFNADPSIFVFLLTTRVGGLGVNLTGADRVVIYDPDWNPATDTQARERAWRIGQQNQVTVYRLVTAGTIEEKIYHRQIFKQFLTNKVLRDPRQRRFFKTNDLFELFTLKDDEEGGSTETAAIFAGTNSEVKVTLNNKEKRKRDDSKPSSSRSTAIIEPKEQAKAPPRESVVKFSQEKLDRMKQLAQMLSKKICEDKETGIGNSGKDVESEDRPVVSEKNEEGVESDLEAIKVEDKDGHQSETEGRDEKTELDESKEQDCSVVGKLVNMDASIEVKPETGSSTGNSKSDKTEGRKENRKVPVNLEKRLPAKSTHSKSGEKRSREKSNRTGHKSKRKTLGAKFEGERVPYLVKHRVAKEEKEAKEKGVEDDDYVLKKLFKKSGLHEALHHDAIVGEGEADYALVEGEARRVADEAVAALHESRRLCFAAEAGVPSWTGQNGAIKTARPRFGKKTAVSAKDPSAAKTKAMTSGELLVRMRERNRLTESAQTATSANVSREDSELLADIRNFVSFGAAVDGMASTRELVNRFGDKLPAGSSPLFKCLLQNIAEFHRGSTGEGMWKLRSEFRW